MASNVCSQDIKTKETRDEVLNYNKFPMHQSTSGYQLATMQVYVYVVEGSAYITLQ